MWRALHQRTEWAHRQRPQRFIERTRIQCLLRPKTTRLPASNVALHEPANGPNFYRLSDFVTYEIHVDVDGDAQSDLTYQFKFKTKIVDPGSLPGLSDRRKGSTTFAGAPATRKPAGGAVRELFSRSANKGFEEWGDVFGDDVMAAALIDRLVHHCHIVTIRGNSYRMRQHTDL